MDVVRASRPWRVAWVVALMLTTTVFLAHFCLSPRLGLYEDDYSVVGGTIALSGDEVIDQLRFLVVHWVQGRPLGALIRTALVRGAFALGGLSAIYALVAVILVSCGWWTYRVLRFCLPPEAALVGALVYLLHPIDTNKPFLTHGLEFHVAMLATLVALSLYQSGHTFRATLLASSSLLIYETAFLPFLVLAPFLANVRPTRGAFGRHVLRCAAAIGAAFLFRLSLDEARAVDAVHRSSDIVGRAVDGLLIGPVLGFAALIERPMEAISGAPTLLLALPVVVVLLYRGLIATAREPDAAPSPHSSPLSTLLAGFVLVVVSYAGAFNYYPLTGVGRTTPHLASLSGYAVFAAGAFESVRRIAARSPIALRLWTLACCAYLGCLVLVGIAVQQNLARSWEQQRHFWREVVRLCPDLDRKTVILVARTDLPGSRYLESFAWTTSITLQLMWDAPERWRDPPRLLVIENWKDALEDDEGALLLRVPAGWSPAHVEDVTAAGAIVLAQEGGDLRRLTGKLPFAKGLAARPTAARSEWTKRPLSPLGSLLLEP